MFTHTTYLEFFKSIARTHKQIGHTDTESHFVRIIPVDDPFAMLNIDQYVNDKRSKLHFPALVLYAYQSTLNDTGDAATETFECSFMVMDKVTVQTFAGEDACITRCEEIMRDIVAYLKRYFRSGQPCPMTGFMRLNNVTIDPIQDGNYWGKKCNFRISFMANDAYKYNADEWIEF